MGTTLTGTTPQDTYDSLIKVTDNGPLSGTLKALSDGLGNDSTLSLSTTAASIAGTLAVTGNVTFDTTTMFVDAAANRVGILTATPTEPLHVEGNIMLAYGSSLKAANATYKTLIETGYNGTSDFVSLYSAGNNIGNATAKITMLANGNVGIGTTAPASILAVSAASPTITLTATTTTATTIGNKNNRLLLLADSSTVGNGGEVVFGTGDTSTKRWAAISGYINANNGTGSAGSIIFATKAAEVDTSLTERVRILNDGGLTFNGDTAQANALDDYEEGTWTMGVSFGGASVGVTYANNTGTYTKIGRQVTVNGYLALSSKGSSTGTALLTGLPFTIPNSQTNLSTASLWLNSVSFLNQHQAVGKTNSTSVEFWEITTLGTATVLTNADFANDSNVIINFTYFV